MAILEQPCRADSMVDIQYHKRLLYGSWRSRAEAGQLTVFTFESNGDNSAYLILA